MRYTVTCAPSVQDELADIWLQASDPRAVSRASNEIDRILRSAPVTRGTKHSSHYALTVEPLTVVYDVSPDDRMVDIRQFIYQT